MSSGRSGHQVMGMNWLRVNPARSVRPPEAAYRCKYATAVRLYLSRSPFIARRFLVIAGHTIRLCEQDLLPLIAGGAWGHVWYLENY